MTNLETNLLEVLTRETIRFVVGPYAFFRPPSRKCVRPSYGTFINGFVQKAFAGPYGSYDKICDGTDWAQKYQHGISHTARNIKERFSARRFTAKALVNNDDDNDDDDDDDGQNSTNIWVTAFALTKSALRASRRKYQKFLKRQRTINSFKRFFQDTKKEPEKIGNTIHFHPCHPQPKKNKPPKVPKAKKYQL